MNYAKVMTLLWVLTAGACGGSKRVPVETNEAGAGDNGYDIHRIVSDGGGDRRCVYKGVTYQDQQEWMDDCNTCKCNPEGSRGVGCTELLCVDGGRDSVPVLDGEGLTFPCGSDTCSRVNHQVCVHPCCDGPAICAPKSDSGICPTGTKEGCIDGKDGCEFTCTPDPPYCADKAPADCMPRVDPKTGDSHADCVCA